MSIKIKILGTVVKLLGPLYKSIKPATLLLVDQDFEITAGRLTYIFKYRLQKGRWSRFFSRKNVLIPLGRDPQILDTEIQLSSEIPPIKHKLSQLEARIDLYQIISPKIENLTDGQSISVSLLTSVIDVSKYIKSKRKKTSPQTQDITYQNTLSRPVKQHEILLDITEPYPIKNIEIKKGEADIGPNRYVKLETKSVQDIKISEISKTFPQGISKDELISSGEKDASSLMKLIIDFEPKEKIEIILYRQ